MLRGPKDSETPPSMADVGRRASALLIFALIAVVAPAGAAGEAEVAQTVARHIKPILAADGAGGVAIAVRVGGRTHFFTEGYAERTSRRPITSDTLFNLCSLAKVFDASLLADAVARREVSFEDSVAEHVADFIGGGDIRGVTLGQLAAYTSGLVLPQDHPPWPAETYTLPAFVARLKFWALPPGRKPGAQMIYSHAGYVLLHLTLERRFGAPFDELLAARVLRPLGLTSTTMPVASADPVTHPRGEIPEAFARRAVQGYGDDGEPIGAPGDIQGYYHWLGTGQMYSSARDMAVFLAANLGELPDNRPLQAAMAVAQRGVIAINDRVTQALAWEVRKGPPLIVDKYGGLNNASAYIGMVPAQKIGIVILGNRGSMDIARTGRAILMALAGK
jgi:beta-lactamase class C